jgi:hypothetical protein
MKRDFERELRRLAPRKIIVGCGEKFREIAVTDQAELRLIDEIVNLLPEKVAP